MLVTSVSGTSAAVVTVRSLGVARLFHRPAVVTPGSAPWGFVIPEPRGLIALRAPRVAVEALVAVTVARVPGLCAAGRAGGAGRGPPPVTRVLRLPGVVAPGTRLWAVIPLGLGG